MNQRTSCLTEVGTFFFPQRRRRSTRVWLRVADLSAQLAVAEGNPLFPQVPTLARVCGGSQKNQPGDEKTDENGEEDSEEDGESWLPAEL